MRAAVDYKLLKLKGKKHSVRMLLVGNKAMWTIRWILKSIFSIELIFAPLASASEHP